MLRLQPFGNDPERVARMSAAYLQGAHTIPGFACAAKHFPGNGLDFRDAHISNNVNDMDVEEWDATYGYVYKTLIEQDLDAIMGGHILMPKYAGALISEKRMEDALKRILGLKARMGLHKKNADELVPVPEILNDVIGNPTYMRMQEDISRDAVTLVKYKDKEVLPITPDKYKRVMIVHIKGNEGSMGELMKAMGYSGGNPAEELRKKLVDKGFEAFIYESPMDKMKKQIAAGEKPNINLYFAGKNAIADFVKDMDIVITLCNVSSGRPSFGMSKGGGEIPWYVFEIPVVVIGCGQPTMLADVPQARTYINTYDSKNSTLDALVDKLMEGPEAFRGIDPIDSFCGLFDARI